ncbi:MAG: dienelactone hydrolase family protein [Deltaproteobacteria bacterium]|nr:dienelactone hydrolase family protein [Deltaproteobacteria bacterium]
MDERIAQLVEQYRAGALSRREFLARLVLITGSLATASALLASLGLGDEAQGAQVPPDAPDLTSSTLQYPSGSVTMSGYLARPRAAGEYPGLIVIHQNTGLNNHIQDVARRFAREGYVALAPDLLSRAGGTGQYATPQDAIAAIGKLTDDQVVQDLHATFAHLKLQPGVQARRIGIIGYCWGGQRSFLFGVSTPELAAVVVYYGQRPAPIDRVQNLAGAFLGIYAERDERITSLVPEVEAALKRYNKPHEIKIYPGTVHAFFDDTRPDRYHPGAAREAWPQTLRFLTRHLKG